MKRSPLKKVSKKPISTMKRKLWKEFSLFIRNRDNFTCFVCGKKGEGGGMHAGHFIPKSVCGIELYFSELNVNAQCYHCNINLGGNGAAYYRKMVTRHGQEAVDNIFDIKDKHHANPSKWSIEDYEEKIAHYKELNK